MAPIPFISLIDFIRGVNPSSPQYFNAVPGVIKEGAYSNGSGKQRIIVVANFLPLNAQKDDCGEWCFSLDEDSILLQLKDGIPHDIDVFYVGSLSVDVEGSKQKQVSSKLEEEFKCLPIFIRPETHKTYYNGFCKQYLWPLFHYMLPKIPDLGNHFNAAALWRAYVSVNGRFSRKIIEAVKHPGEDYVWIHDYHLMALPLFLRHRFHRCKMGFFLHSPFPPLEIFMTLPIAGHILKALLNSDLIGFQTFEYAHHFVSCCSQLLGLGLVYTRDHIEIEYFGRNVNIKILPAGIHMSRLRSSLNHPSSSDKVREIREQFKGKTLILGVDDLDIIKGVDLKLKAVEQLLQKRPSLRGELVIVQILNPPRRTGQDVEETKKEIFLAAEGINERFGSEDYKPVIIIDHPTPFYEKAAYFASADCCIVSALRDGMNLVPYMYVACRQGTPEMDQVLELGSEPLHTSALVLSEFLGCSPSLTGAFRVNPWDIDAMAEALGSAIDMLVEQKHLRHEEHFRHVSSHDVAYWARSFLKDLERACVNHQTSRCWGLGLSFDFRVMFVPMDFWKLSNMDVVSAYEKTACRAIILDYEDTLVFQFPFIQESPSPTPELISVINDLCNDPKNAVFIVSDFSMTQLSDWFDSCENLGIAAENGYLTRWGKNSSWETSDSIAYYSWEGNVGPETRSNSRLTGGSYIESKESGLTWRYHEYDSSGYGYGNSESKDLFAHLGRVLEKESGFVGMGGNTIELNPKGFNKGKFIEKVLSALKMEGKSVDFVLCVGNDRSDEEMFASISSQVERGVLSAEAETVTCTVEMKPSKAKYFLNDPTEVMDLLGALAASGSESNKLMKGNVSSEGTKV